MHAVFKLHFYFYFYFYLLVFLIILFLIARNDVPSICSLRVFCSLVSTLVSCDSVFTCESLQFEGQSVGPWPHFSYGSKKRFCLFDGLFVCFQFVQLFTCVRTEWQFHTFYVLDQNLKTPYNFHFDVSWPIISDQFHRTLKLINEHWKYWSISIYYTTNYIYSYL